jgi:hypothetical protein
MGKKVQKQKKQPKTEKTPKPDDKDAESEGSDFGGLPQRDLKKNLGCG